MVNQVVQNKKTQESYEILKIFEDGLVWLAHTTSKDITEVLAKEFKDDYRIVSIH